MSKVENTKWKKTNIFTFGNFFFVGIFCPNLFLALSHCKKGIFFVLPKYAVCCTDTASEFILRETVPSQTSDMGKKTLPVLAHSF